MKIVAETRLVNRYWVTSVMGGAVHAHGRNLRKLRESVVGALGLVLSLEERKDLEVEVVPLSPGLVDMRRRRTELDSAAVRVVQELSVRQVSIRDIGIATGLTMPQVRRVMVELKEANQLRDSSGVHQSRRPGSELAE